MAPPRQIAWRCLLCSCWEQNWKRAEQKALAVEWPERIGNMAKDDQTSPWHFWQVGYIMLLCMSFDWMNSWLTETADKQWRPVKLFSFKFRFKLFYYYLKSVWFFNKANFIYLGLDVQYLMGSTQSQTENITFSLLPLFLEQFLFLPRISHACP